MSTLPPPPQAAKTYLERKFETFEDATLDELIQHALTALKESCTEGDLNSKNCSLAIVGLDRPLGECTQRCFPRSGVRVTCS